MGKIIDGKPIGRNAQCLCGSNKKYKKCCLLKEETKRKTDKPKGKKIDIKFEQVPQSEIKAEQVKRVIERLKRAYGG